jgi:hypothetical protein
MLFQILHFPINQQYAISSVSVKKAASKKQSDCTSILIDEILKFCSTEFSCYETSRKGMSDGIQYVRQSRFFQNCRATEEEFNSIYCSHQENQL